jgi:ABC-2 type transport system ATP-binding protein
VGVDPQSRERIFEAVTGLAHKGAGIIYCTHDMQEAERLCHRVVFLDAGRVVATGTPAQLVAASGATSSVLLRTARPLPPGWLNGMHGARVLSDDGAETVIAVAGAAAVAAVLMAATRTEVDVLEFTLQRPNLADAFFKVTGRAVRDDNGALAGTGAPNAKLAANGNRVPNGNGAPVGNGVPVGSGVPAGNGVPVGNGAPADRT